MTEVLFPTVKAPRENARMSVIEVTVIDTPACFKVLPIFSSSVKDFLLGSARIFCQHSEMTNMSSIPIPERHKN